MPATKKNNADITITLWSLEYNYLPSQSTKTNKIVDHYVCDYELVESVNKRSKYQFTIERFTEPERFYKARLSYAVLLDWKYDPDPDKDIGPVIKRVKDILAIRASHTIAAVTSESFNLPSITPPFFDDELDENES